jgi:hypothetical protein
VVAYWPALMRRSSVTARVVAIAPDGGEQTQTVRFADAPPPSPDHVPAPRPRRPRRKAWPGRTRRVPLRVLAHARSGDKGDTCNVGVCARSPEIHDFLREALTAGVVKRFFQGIVRGRVTRHELPNLLALNFLMERALGGGGTVSLMLDPQGKTLSQALLEMELEVPRSLVPRS